MKLRELLEEKKLTVEQLTASIKDGRFTLDGSKLNVSTDFSCDNKQLTSLKGAPQSITGIFSCYRNLLTSLAGAPRSIGKSFSCSLNKITSLKDVHKHVKEINGRFYANNNPITSHVLGLLLIKGLTEVELDNKEVEEILNKHLPNTHGHTGVLDCQSELLDAGFEEYAQL